MTQRKDHQRDISDYLLKDKWMGAALAYGVTFTAGAIGCYVTSLIFATEMCSTLKIMMLSIFGIFFVRMQG
jgi:hypothetical protein